MRDPSPLELAELVCPELEALGISYAITGSVAIALHGEPFDSQDVDIDLRIAERQAEQLAALKQQAGT